MVKIYTIVDYKDLLVEICGHDNEGLYPLLVKFQKVIQQNDPQIILSSYLRQKTAHELFTIIGFRGHHGEVSRCQLKSIEILGDMGDKETRQRLFERSRLEYNYELSEAIQNAIDCINKRLGEK